MSYEKGFYEEKSWGSIPIEDKKDLPSLKLKYLMELLVKRKKKNASLLEIGCGSGRILSTIQQRDGELQLTGVDISKEQVRIAKRDNPGITFKVGNAERLPFKTGSFDYVIFLDVIEHVEHPNTLLKEASRVLKEGGYLYGVSPCEKQGIYVLSTKLLGWHIKERTAGHIQQFTVNDFLKRVRKQNLRIIKTLFSYHLLGSIMDYTLFTLLLNKKMEKLFWSKNTYYQNRKTKQTVASLILNTILQTGNAIAYTESSLLRNTRLLATAVHVTARKY